MRRTAPLALLLLLVLASVALASTKTLSATESDGLGYSKKTITVGARQGHAEDEATRARTTSTTRSTSAATGVEQALEGRLAGRHRAVTAKLKKGTYTFYCEVQGHEADGMKGKLVVK